MIDLVEKIILVGLKIAVGFTAIFTILLTALVIGSMVYVNLFR